MVDSCVTRVGIPANFVPLPATTTSTFHPSRVPSLLTSNGEKSDTYSSVTGVKPRSVSPEYKKPQVMGSVSGSSFPANGNGAGPGTGSMYQIHDGFATVRKRKGPSCASLALRQQQECYDLASPLMSARGSVPVLKPVTLTIPHSASEGALKQKGGGGKLLQMTNGRDESSNTNSMNGHYASVSLGKNSMNVTTNATRPTNSWESHQPHCPLSGKGAGGLGTRPGVNPNTTSCSCYNPMNGNGTKPDGPGTKLKSSNSLRRKLRRFVLPSKLFPPPAPSATANGNHSMQSPWVVSKGPPQPNYPNSPPHLSNGNGAPQLYTTRLRNSVSDNSIASQLGQNGHHRLQPDPTCNGGGGQGRSFHRSCVFPKPPLEPVLEDGIPWRPRKDIPWWELATKKHRYRSCPILQVTQQAHVVAAFEQSLSNMTHRLQNLTLTAEQKDSELNELRRTIELLRKQSIEAGLTVANLSSGISRDGSPIARQLSADSVSSINSISSACSGTSHSHTSSPSGQIQMTPLGTPTHHGTLITAPDSPNSRKKHSKNKGWLRSSFTKAFSRSKSKTRNGSVTDMNYEDGNRCPSNLNGDSPQHHYAQHGHQQSLKQYENSAPASPLLASPHGGNSSGHSNGCGSSSGSHSPHSNGRVKGSGSFSALGEDGDSDKHKSVDDLKKQLREKEMVLTDIRLEALTSAHQLESLKETVTKMRNEMLSLKQDNDRLQRMVTYKSLNSSQTSLQTSALESLDRRLSASEVPPPTGIDMLLADPSEKEGKRIVVTVYLGCHGSNDRYVNPGDGFFASECAVGTVAVSSRTKWDLLDSVVRRTFKDYVMRVDPVSNLGLSADSIISYNVGEVVRSKETQLPELLPCGYLVGDVNKVRICLKGALHNGSVDALAFETLIPKSILQRYVSLLSECGRLILCGPSGTGKSYLARKLGEFVVAKSGKEPCPEAIATFSADHKNSKELRLYLSNLAEQSESGSVDLPAVIILDNLHQVQSFGEVFNGFFHSKQSSSRPLIIGTMTQSTANLQLHHSFRWVLFGNNTEPTKGLLSRYLQRRLVEADIQSGTKNVELARIMEWVPEAWLHINKFLEKHNSSDVTIGPRLFLSCPTDVANSQVWFTDLWHYSIIPYLIEAVKEGLQLFGKKAQWEDPSQFLLQSYPWNESHALATTKSSILRLRPEDVGYDVKTGATNSTTKPNQNDGPEPDPLLNMLMRLQEAANYTDPQSNDSDSTSLDSKDFTATA